MTTDNKEDRSDEPTVDVPRLEPSLRAKSSPTRLRSKVPRYPTSWWLIGFSGFLNRFGNGLIYPFIFIFLHNVVGFTFPVAGAVLALVGFSGLFVGPPVGVVVDRVGAKPVLFTALITLAIGYGAFGFARSALVACVAAALAGIGNAAFWPSQSALVAQIVTREQRHLLFAFDYAAANAGIGLGAAVGSVLVATLHGQGFTLLFVGDALTFIACAVLVPLIRIHPIGDELVPSEEQSREEALRPTTGHASGYRKLLRDRALLRVLVLRCALVGLGYMQLQGLPLFAVNIMGIPAFVLGGILIANTVANVAVQLPISHRLTGSRRMRLIASEAGIWAVCWLIIELAATLLTGAPAITCVIVVAAVFSIGEALDSSVFGPLIADLAPSHLLGRYMSGMNVAWQLGLTIGPILTGVIMGISPGALWPTCAVLLLAVGGGSLLSERLIPLGLQRVGGLQG